MGAVEGVPANPHSMSDDRGGTLRLPHTGEGGMDRGGTVCRGGSGGHGKDLEFYSKGISS